MDHPQDRQKLIVTPPGRLSFPAVFKPEKKMEGDTLQYSVTLLFPKTEDIEPIRKLANETFRARWPDPAKQPKNPRKPIRDGDEESWEGYAGHWFIKAKSLFPPGVVNAKLQKIVSDSELYPGCWVRAQIGAWAYDTKGNTGVSFNLYNLMKVRDDTPFMKREDAEGAFSAYADKAAGDGSDDPKNYPAGDKGGDSDLPF
jgi:hypothetical protein